MHNCMKRSRAGLFNGGPYPTIEFLLVCFYLKFLKFINLKYFNIFVQYYVYIYICVYVHIISNFINRLHCILASEVYKNFLNNIFTYVYVYDVMRILLFGNLRLEPCAH